MPNGRPPRKTLRGPETLEVRRLLARVAWPVEAGGNGHEYEPVAEFVTWEEARAVAAARGGHLVTLTSEGENEFVFGLVNAPEFWHDAAPVWGPWIGAFQDPAEPLEPEGGWRWVTGEPWTYHNWRSSEPNDLGGEEYAHFNADGFAPAGRAATWNDQGPLAPLAFVIEYDEFADQRDFRAGDSLEPNDAFFIAADLGMGNDLERTDLALADAVDRDWLRFVPETSGYARIRLAPPTGVARDLIAGIFDAHRQGLAASNEEGSNTRLLHLTAGETYVLAVGWTDPTVGPSAGWPLPYSLSIDAGLDLAALEVPLSAARPLNLPTTGSVRQATARGLLRGNEQRDLHSFQVSDATPLQVSLTASLPEQVQLRLLDAQGTPVGPAAEARDGVWRIVGDLPASAGYYLEVAHQGSWVDQFYRLEVNLTRPVGEATNISPETALALGIREEISLSSPLQPNGFEGVFFTLEPARDGRYWVDATTDGFGDVNLEVSSLAAPTQKVSGTRILEVELTAGTSYLIRLTGFGPANLTWRMRPTGDAALPDRFESNNTPQTAAALEVVDQVEFTGLSLHADPSQLAGRDRDYYRILAPDTGILAIELDELGPLPNEARLVLRRSDGLTAPWFFSNETRRASLPLAAGLELSLEVQSSGHAVSIGYRLRLQVAPLPDGEPGDAPLEWGPLGSLPATRYASDYDGDVDRYRFTALSTGTAIVSVRREHGPADAQVFLSASSAAGSRPMFSRPRGDGWTDYRITALSGETIELRLETAPGGYLLAVDSVAGQDAWEPNNVPAEVDATFSASPSEHLLGPGDEVDLITLFRLPGYAGTASASFAGAELGLELTLVDRQGTVLSQGITAENQATVLLPFSAVSEQCFLRVARTRGQGRYTISIANLPLFDRATSFDAAVDRGTLNAPLDEAWNIPRAIAP